METNTPLALIFTGGAMPNLRIANEFGQPQLVIAADSGWHFARAFGYVPQFLVGDFDSISDVDLQEARTLDTEIIQHPVDKDFTDTEIALNLARSMKYERIHIVSGGGDRFDHLVALLHSLVGHTQDAQLTAHIGDCLVHFVTPKQRFVTNCAPNTTVSLIPLGGSARGVRSEGLKWNLSRKTLHSFASRGISNQTISDSFSISVRTGVIGVFINQLTKETP